MKDSETDLSWSRVLVVGAHPDDEVLGCGGTLARFRAAGKDVHALILSDVTTSRTGEPGDPAALGAEAQRAAEVLGFTSLTRGDFPDNRFDTLPMLEIIKRIEELKTEVEPDLVLCHDPIDLNLDHQIVHQAVLTAFRSLPGETTALMTFETSSSTEYQDPDFGGFCPNFYIDISDHLEAKIHALECYRSEMRAAPHPRSIEGIRNLARRRGMEAGCEYAEAFRIMRWLLR